MGGETLMLHNHDDRWSCCGMDSRLDNPKLHRYIKALSRQTVSTTFPSAQSRVSFTLGIQSHQGTTTCCATQKSPCSAYPKHSQVPVCSCTLKFNLSHFGCGKQQAQCHSHLTCPSSKRRVSSVICRVVILTIHSSSALLCYLTCSSTWDAVIATAIFFPKKTIEKPCLHAHAYIKMITWPFSGISPACLLYRLVTLPIAIWWSKMMSACPLPIPWIDQDAAAASITQLYPTAFEHTVKAKDACLVCIYIWGKTLDSNVWRTLLQKEMCELDHGLKWTGQGQCCRWTSITT